MASANARKLLEAFGVSVDELRDDDDGPAMVARPALRGLGASTARVYGVDDAADGALHERARATLEEAARKRSRQRAGTAGEMPSDRQWSASRRVHAEAGDGGDAAADSGSDSDDPADSRLASVTRASRVGKLLVAPATAVAAPARGVPAQHHPQPQPQKASGERQQPPSKTHQPQATASGSANGQHARVHSVTPSGAGASETKKKKKKKHKKRSKAATADAS